MNNDIFKGDESAYSLNPIGNSLPPESRFGTYQKLGKPN
jgi:hypothetical protein